jgi:hypothetical protein
VIGYRFNVCIVAFERPDAMSYFPTLVELGVSLGIVAGAMLLFIFFVERLRVYDEEHWEGPLLRKPSFEPYGTRLLLPEPLAAPGRYSLAFVLAASITVAALPEEVLWGPRFERTPVEGARVVEGLMQTRPGASGHELAIMKADYPVSAGSRAVELMVIDGNRDGRLVLFAHDEHVAQLEEEAGNLHGPVQRRQPDIDQMRVCATCHHQSLPYSRNSACGACHSDMYLETDIFGHAAHVAKLDGNNGCSGCHEDSRLAKTRSTTKACMDCHEEMVAVKSRIEPPEGGTTGYAVGYTEAMHDLCIGCHEEKAGKEPATYGKDFSTCKNCHRDADDSQLRQMAPYVARDTVPRPQGRGGERFALWFAGMGAEAPR